MKARPFCSHLPLLPVALGIGISVGVATDQLAAAMAVALAGAMLLQFWAGRRQGRGGS